MIVSHYKLSWSPASAAIGILLASSVHAAPPEQRHDQVDGWFRMLVGQHEVTALYDGYVDIDTQLLSGMNAEQIRERLDSLFIASENGVQTAVNAFLVHTGDHLVLVDAGSAACFGPSLGHVADNLRASGYTPEDVDTVLMTHLHPDHVCGLTNSDGQAVYPNAELRVSQADADYWLSEEQAAAAPENKQPFFAMARDAVAPYQQTEQVVTFQPGDELLEGVEAMDTAGHTPGHASFQFQNGDHGLFIWGDIVHSHGVQFANPDVAIEFDSDQQQAVESRRSAMGTAADEGWWVAGAHMPFPGIGHVIGDSDGYRWLPVEFGPIRE